ncbi:MAG: EAL domain-containing protein, partial [Campylobacterota bacterium]|nr:EAL domain-containing protein [Campylobacterota bacterium]
MSADVSRLKDITVLYCEDEDSLREVTGGILKSFTKKQFIAVDGAEGLGYFRANQDEIDLVITDVNMPNMSGLEMAKEIKALNANMPIIVATAFSNSEYLLEAIDLGVDKYVLKPINIKKLLDTMAKSLLYHELRDLYLDQLTLLPNRNSLIKDIKALNQSMVALIDIDEFSVLNDLYGEKNGDEILVLFSKKIKEYFANDEYKIYRVGSDKFVVLCKDQDKKVESFKKSLESLLSHMDTHGIILSDNIIDLNITIGVAQAEDQHTFEYAQRVLQKARKKFIQLMIYDKATFEQKEDFEENIKWIKKLKNGITDGSFQPFFQPIVDSKTQEVYKYESLIRYIEKDGTEIAPYKFLPIAKKAKLFPTIIRVMLTSVMKTIKEKKVKVAVNVSFDDIVNKETYDFIILTLISNPEEAKLLDFEILESEEIKDFDLVRSFIDEVRSYGCDVGVDDFGAGYSNFNMLEALNIDFVKIDGSLIKEIDYLPKQALIVETISQFCSKLGIKTVAEFVSSEEIYKEVNNLGINYMQGYHFGKPICYDDLK